MKHMKKPVKRIVLRDMFLSKEEYERVVRGLKPGAMEDKWHNYFEDGKLYCCRSWTGECIYIVEFAPSGGGYEAAAFLTPAERTRENVARAVVGTLLYFMAGNHLQQIRYMEQYEALSSPFTNDLAASLLLYTTFGLQVLGDGAEDDRNEDEALTEAVEYGPVNWYEAVRSGLFGVCAGDALGVPVEFQSQEILDQNPVVGMSGGGVHGQPAGTWSDDSSMTLCLADSIVKTRGVHTHDIMERFLTWYQDGAYTPWVECFDIGHTTAQALLRYQNGTDPALCGGNKWNTNGNGSLMRILPLAFELYRVYGPNLTASTKAMEMIHRISGLTHRHALAQSACGIYLCVAVKLLDIRWRAVPCRRLQDLGESALPHRRRCAERTMLGHAIAAGICEAVEWYRQRHRFASVDKWWKRLLRLEQLRGIARQDVRSGGYVIETLEAAFWCLLNTDNYADCVLAAVNLGHDADTTAAVAGGLAGLAYGYDSIPSEWMAELKRKEFIHECCNGLAAHCSR